MLLTENRVEEAITCFQRALLSPGRSPELTAYCYERLGFVAFYEMRDSAGALSFLIKAIDTYPAAAPRLWLVQVHTLRSRVLRETRQYEAALDAAEAALTVAQAAGSEGKIGLADALLTAGETTAEFRGNEHETIAYLTQFLQISRKPLGVDVTWSRVQEMLGDAYSKTGQHQQAVGAYQAALRYNPYHPWEQSLDYRIARNYYQLGDYPKAIAQLDKLIKATEADGQTISDYRIFNVLGNALFALGQYPRAMQAYQSAIEIAPPNVNVTRIHEYYQFAREQTRPA
ncbi:MAG: tetratricopeptide repeat protein [Blastochloris sp.]|nr:tetratricopeptide repeat protein [Blastochloris sp.]